MRIVEWRRKGMEKELCGDCRRRKSRKEMNVLFRNVVVYLPLNDLGTAAENSK